MRAMPQPGRHSTFHTYSLKVSNPHIIIPVCISRLQIQLQSGRPNFAAQNEPHHFSNGISALKRLTPL
jgi:hypothetical protein